ncbi:hypothetical protein CHS0354_033917 [Potamilus streckersoni]|uniref:Uncharacterized protein n=1 Tax=Potamilus streckersoni TaxID=2493646 RepID=A0AAE0RWT1_9BIVA|nr:hypothetical protein CHS0354_033917 [Potamilus streckersoni]
MEGEHYKVKGKINVRNVVSYTMKDPCKVESVSQLNISNEYKRDKAEKLKMEKKEDINEDKPTSVVEKDQTCIVGWSFIVAMIRMAEFASVKPAVAQPLAKRKLVTRYVFCIFDVCVMLGDIPGNIGKS